MWPAGAENVLGPASARINMALGLVVSRRSSAPISRRNSIPSLVLVEEIVLPCGCQWKESCLISVRGIVPRGPDKG